MAMGAAAAGGTAGAMAGARAVMQAGGESAVGGGEAAAGGMIRGAGGREAAAGAMAAARVAGGGGEAAGERLVQVALHVRPRRALVRHRSNTRLPFNLIPNLRGSREWQGCCIRAGYDKLMDVHLSAPHPQPEGLA